MTINVIGQGGQNNVTLGQNNIEPNISLKEKTAEVSFVTGNEKTSQYMDNRNKQQREITEDKVKKSVDKINKFLQGESTHVEYERHDKLKTQFVIRIIDNKTKEVIKEIPPKKILDMVAEMCRMAGIMFDEKA